MNMYINIEFHVVSTYKSTKSNLVWWDPIITNLHPHLGNARCYCDHVIGIMNQNPCGGVFYPLEL